MRPDTDKNAQALVRFLSPDKKSTADSLAEMQQADYRLQRMADCSSDYTKDQAAGLPDTTAEEVDRQAENTVPRHRGLADRIHSIPSDYTQKVLA